MFIPILAKMIQFDEHSFQMGWFNHQHRCLLDMTDMTLKNSGFQKKRLSFSRLLILGELAVAIGVIHFPETDWGAKK